MAIWLAVNDTSCTAFLYNSDSFSSRFLVVDMNLTTTISIAVSLSVVAAVLCFVICQRGARRLPKLRTISHVRLGSAHNVGRQASSGRLGTTTKGTHAADDDTDNVFDAVSGGGHTATTSRGIDNFLTGGSDDVDRDNSVELTARDYDSRNTPSVTSIEQNSSHPRECESNVLGTHGHPVPVTRSDVVMPQSRHSAVGHELQPRHSGGHEPASIHSGAEHELQSRYSAGHQIHVHESIHSAGHEPQSIHSGAGHEPQSGAFDRGSDAFASQSSPGRAMATSVTSIYGHVPRPVLNASGSVGNSTASSAVGHEPQSIHSAVAHQPQLTHSAFAHEPLSIHSAVGHEPQHVHSAAGHGQLHVHSAAGHGLQSIHSAVGHEPQHTATAASATQAELIVDEVEDMDTSPDDFL